jgi:uncharacterized protein YjbI with pentapeptide repeats
VRRILDHRRWLDSDGRAGARLEGDDLNLTGYDFDFVDFSRANMAGAEFGTSTLKGARFVECNLEDGSFGYCELEGTNFSRAKLKGASFVSANYAQASFEGAEIEHTEWSEEAYRPPRPPEPQP